MPHPRTAAEWDCFHDYEKCLCIACADAYARQQAEGARLDWACPLCHCCGEKRHDGDDPCVSCQSAVEAERERVAQIVDQWACSKTCDPTGAPCEHIRVATTIAAAIRALREGP